MIISELTAEGRSPYHRGRTPNAQSAEDERSKTTTPSDDRVSVSENLQDHEHDSDELSEDVIRRTRQYHPPYGDGRLDLLDHWCPSERKCPSCWNGDWEVENGHAPSDSTPHLSAVARDDNRDRGRPRLPPTGPRAAAWGPRQWHPYDPSRRRVKEGEYGS
jgi:hypothetical protein